MSRGKASGYTLTRTDAKIVLGMQAREDREHDIAAWFGVNQARVAEVKGGKFGTLEAGLLRSYRRRERQASREKDYGLP